MIKKIPSEKMCQHGKYRWTYNLQREWIIKEEKKDEFHECCNEKMDIVFPSESKAELDEYQYRLSYCQCCGKLINKFGVDLTNLDTP